MSTSTEISTRHNNLAPIHTVAEIHQMAIAVARSGLFGITNENQAMALLMVAQANGLHPMKAVERFHIINGKPAKKADAMLSDFQKSGGRIKWTQYTDTICEAVFTFDGSDLSIAWTIKMAQDAGLNKNLTWKKFPRQMLKARVISEGVRALCPAVTDSMYTPEEVEDFDKPKDVTPVQPVKAVPTNTVPVSDYDKSVLIKLESALKDTSNLDELTELDELLESIKSKMHIDCYNTCRVMLSNKSESLLNEDMNTGSDLGGVMGDVQAGKESFGAGMARNAASYSGSDRTGYSMSA